MNDRDKLIHFKCDYCGEESLIPDDGLKLDELEDTEVAVCTDCMLYLTGVYTLH